jgi:signal transduction histidine kinase
VRAGPALGALLAGLLVDRRRAVVRRRRLNRALHELRRPLQALDLTLASPGTDRDCAASCLEQVRRGLDQLDEAVNGSRTVASPPARVALADLAGELERRWRHAGVRVEAPERDAIVAGDRRELAAALDNLVCNALRHGSHPIRVSASAAPGLARIEVRDGGPVASGAPVPSDPRHGHGLRLVAGIAKRHGGRVQEPTRSARGGTVASISLPAGRTAGAS